jgi:Glycosyltransferase like family 2
MHARVTAILVARNGAQYLGRTLASLAAQNRRPDTLVFVDAGSADASAELLAAAGPTQFVTVQGKPSFGDAVARALRVVAGAEGDNDWLWLLRHDSAPDSNALTKLLAAVEIAPSVAVAGPKLMRWERPQIIADYGESITRGGASVSLIVDELDQGQHDRQSDLLAVSSAGMLVRHRVFAAVGGFDPALPSVDAALDFCIRVRLAGHRVIGVPDAKAAISGPPELFTRASVSRSQVARMTRAAELHRRLVYAPAAALPIHWLALLPLAILRTVVQLAAKRPWAIVGEYVAAAQAAFGGGVTAARRNVAKTRRLGWAVIAPFFVSARDAREYRAIRGERDGVDVAALDTRTRPGFFSHGGAWIVIILAAVGVVSFSRLLGAAAVSGGGLLPLSAEPAMLWSNVGYGWREIGAGFVGAADPFSYLLAVLGSVFFWAPSTAIVVLYLAAIPLAALAAWLCAARLSIRGWAPALAAVLWALSPAFLASLSGGHLGAVVAHLLLPWLILASIRATKSWSAAAVAAILFAATLASAPVLAPALLTVWLVAMISLPRSAHRLIGIPIPAAALFAPLVYQQISRGNWIALFADPGLPTASGAPTGLQLALGSPLAGYNGWSVFGASIGLPALAAPLIVAAMLAPLALLALLALFLPGARRSVPALGLALIGFLTAVFSSHLAVSTHGSATTAIWAGSGLSLFWLGLVGASIVAIEALGKAAALATLLAVVGAMAVAVPLVASPLLAPQTVQASSGRLLPAFVGAESAKKPWLGTLELRAEVNGLDVTLQRGVGTTLDAQSTLAATSQSVSADQRALAKLAANLASVSGFDPTPDLQKLHIAFVLIPDATGEGAALRARAVDALEANPAFTTIGETARGLLWHYSALVEKDRTARPGPAGTSLGRGVLIGQSIVFGLALILAIPLGKRRRTNTSRADAELMDTFDEDDDA